MKKTLLKVLSSTLALTLVATASVATASVKEIPVQEIKARPAAVVQEVKEEATKGAGIIEAIEAKAKETVKVETVKAAPDTKAAPVEKLAPVKAAEEVAVPDAAPVPAVYEEAEPEMVWDISATEFDNVAMAFYSGPIAASQVKIEDDGLVVISGKGAMEDAVYRHFMTVEKYLTAVTALFKEVEGVDVDVKYDESIIDVLELDKTIEFYSKETGERLGVTEEMRQMIEPKAFLEYSPKAIQIKEGITNISDHAFLCCSDLEAIYLPSTIEEIGASAFEYCDKLTTIVIPENAKIDSTAFVYCDSLATIHLANADYYRNGGMIVADADGEITCVRALSAEEVNALVDFWKPAPQAPVVENPIIIEVTDGSCDHSGGSGM